MLRAQMTDEELGAFFADLTDPFSPEDVSWRIGQKTKDGKRAKMLAYIDARTVQNRLDQVVGPQNWQNSFSSGPNSGFLCGIAIKINGEWIWKFDGADKTDIEGTKGGFSDAMKRAGYQWGIGRYLYDLPSPWVELNASGFVPDDWKKPTLPEWAKPRAMRKGAQSGGQKTTETKATTTEATAASETKPAADPAKIEKAKAYKIPEGTPMAGKTLGEAMNDVVFGVPILKFLAGAEANPQGQKFAPTSKEETALQKAAEYLLQNAVLPTAA